jgi:hypothetical protein
MLYRIPFCAAGAVVLLTLSSSSPSVQAGSQDTPYSATVTFRDDPSDGITSDGGGSYGDSSNRRLEVAFHSVTGDLVMRGNARRLMFNLSGRISGTGPTGVVVDELFMNIRNILALPSGAAMETIAVFRPSIGVLRFDPAADDGATLVYVSRLDQTWTVTADPANAAPAGDVAVMHQTRKGKTVNVGLYRLPFEITVDCPSCPL